ncbi:MAG: hypothetical protein ACI4SB_04690 [Acutalibacteraceae bacterium]
MLWEILSALGVVFLFLSVFFICTVILCRLILPGEKGGYYTVIPGLPDDEQLAQKVFAAYIQTNIFTLIKKNMIIVLDYGVSEQVKRECSEILGEHNILFCSHEDFGDIVDGCY